VRKQTILAVDDLHANLMALDAVLRRDFDVVFAHSGQEAIDVLQRRSDVDVILVDLHMPRMDGFEAAEHIRAMHGCRDIPIAFITAIYNEDPYVKRGYQAGGVDFITKPFDPELLRLKMSIYASFRRKAAMLKEREDQVRATEALLEAERRLAEVRGGLTVGILIADLDGRIRQGNDEVARICRATGLDHAGVLDWWDRQEGLVREPGAGESRSAPIPLRCCDGSEKRIVAKASALFGRTGEIVGAVVVIDDVTQSKEIEAELAARFARVASLGAEIEPP
jgi:CheY-like chemotaxis protein